MFQKILVALLALLLGLPVRADENQKRVSVALIGSVFLGVGIQNLHYARTARKDARQLAGWASVARARASSLTGSEAESWARYADTLQAKERAELKAQRRFRRSAVPWLVFAAASFGGLAYEVRADGGAMVRKTWRW